MDPQNPVQTETTANIPQDKQVPPMMDASYNWARTIGLSLGVLTLGLAIAFGGFYLGQKSVIKIPETVQIAQPSKAIILSPTTSPIINSNILTYSDHTFGASFSYPNTWEVIHVDALPSYWLQLRPKNPTSPATYNGPILIAIGTSDTSPVNIRNFLTPSSDNKNPLANNITISGKQGLQMINTNCEPYICDKDTVVAATNTTVYLLHSFKGSVAAPAPLDQNDAYNLLLQTFTFLK